MKGEACLEAPFRKGAPSTNTERKDYLVVMHDLEKLQIIRHVRKAVSRAAACVVADIQQRSEEVERGFVQSYYRGSLTYLAGH